ncbi:ABC transporter permease, partial [Corallococcus sp. bb12-1]|uniref:ABC transporter permease n=1 Tax=Corallococcus sp. bb12-1 TaxID=2996784 RepID=UPI00227060B0
LELGGTFELRKGRPVSVVGVMADGGSAYESEIWADLDAVQSAFGRGGLVSAVRVKLAPGVGIDAFNARLLADRRLGVEAFLERTYYERQAEGSSAFVEFMGSLMAFFFAAAAMLGAMITMNATIAARRREIGTLRALGFSRGSIVFSLVVEACLLALMGGGVGALASLALGFVRIPMMSSSSWSEIVFALEPTSGAIAGAMVAALLVGLFGGLVPALRAARIPAVTAMRE